MLGPDAGRRERSGLTGLLADYLALTKPPIISLLLVTAIGGMFLASRHIGGSGVPDLLTLLLVCVGGALGAGGANAINHYLDQDIDALMSRTAQRPVPGHRVRPLMALAFGIGLNVAAFGVLFLLDQSAGGGADAGGDAVLRAGLHWLAQAQHAAEHRHRRRGGQHPARCGLGGGYRELRPARALYVRHHILLDAAPLLGAVAADTAGLRAGRGADAAGGGRTGEDGEQHFRLLAGAGGSDPGVRRHESGGRGLPVLGGAAGRGLRVGGLAAAAATEPAEGPQTCTSTPCSTWPCCSAR